MRFVVLNSQSPLPLYHQLAEIITEQIRSGVYRPGEAIPSETAIAGQYGIGRPTVRQALGLLVQRGLLERKRGSGTFVRKREELDLFSLTGTSQAFMTRGVAFESRLIQSPALFAVEKDENNPFNGETVFFLSRLTRVENIPILLEDFFFQPRVFAGLDQIPLDGQSLSRLVSDRYGLQPETGRQTFRIAYLSSDRARLLDLAPGHPILEVERILDFSVAGAALFSRLFCRTERFAFSQTLHLT